MCHRETPARARPQNPPGRGTVGIAHRPVTDGVKKQVSLLVWRVPSVKQCCLIPSDYTSARWHQTAPEYTETKMRREGRGTAPGPPAAGHCHTRCSQQNAALFRAIPGTILNISKNSITSVYIHSRILLIATFTL